MQGRSSEQGRINPQEIAAREYKAPAVGVASRAVASDPAVKAAMDVMRQLSGMSAQPGPVPAQFKPAHVPVRAIVAKPSVTRVGNPSDNIATAMVFPAVVPPVVAPPAVVPPTNWAPIVSASEAAVARMKNEELQAKYDAARKDLDDVTAQFLGEQEQSQFLNDRISSLQEQNEALQAKYDAECVRSTNFERQVRDVTRDNATLSQKIIRMAAQLSCCGDYDSILAQLINSHESVNSLEDELSVLKEQMSSLEDELSSLKEQMKGDEISMQRNKEDHANVVEDLNNARGLVETLQALVAKEHEAALHARKVYAEMAIKYNKLTEATRQFIALTDQ